jgi:TRAP-type C4-dicarboxylate transport system permease small subunit
MESIRGVADRLIGLSAIIGSLGLLFEVGVILTDVIGRAFGRPLLGSQDLITMSMVIVVFGGMAICDRRGGHIAIDVFERFFPGGMNRIVDVVSALLGAAIFVTMAWAVNESAKISIMLNLSTNLLNLPKAWFQWMLCAFALLTAFGMALRAIELAAYGRDVRSKELGE